MNKINKKYSIILADPPWFYNGGRKKSDRFSGGARGHYPVMKFSEIQKLPVSELAAENCALFLWATMPNLNHALKTIDAWGFKYKTVGFTWIKTNKRTQGQKTFTKKDIFFGVGYYTKSNAELCLMATKGRMKPVSNSISSVIVSPLQGHSKKPDYARDRIVQLFGDIPRIELFARQHTEGWDSWGNEVDSKTGWLNIIEKWRGS